MALREADSMNHLRLKEKMLESDCQAVFSDGRVLPALIYKTGGQTKFTVELENQFFEASTLPGFVRYERKPAVVPIPEAPAVQVVNEPVIEEPVVDTSGQRLRLHLARNPDAILKRNIIRQVFGNLLVTEFLGVGERDSSTRYWSCRCKITGKYVTATQGDLTIGEVTCCNNAKKPKDVIVFRGAQMPY
jgi:hypothetical protein